MPENKLFRSSRDDRVLAAASAVVIMLAAHGFAFANLMYTHDSLVLVERNNSRIALGRWAGHYYVRYLRDTFSAPWLIGMIMTACVALSVVLVTDLLELTRVQTVACAALMAVNISFTALIASFINYSDTYGFALLFACAAVFARERFPKGWNIAAPIVFICLSMGFYQTYASCAAVLFIFLVVKKLPGYVGKRLAPLVKEGFWYIGMLAGGSVLYVIMMKLVMAVNGVEAGGGYNGPARVSELSLVDIISSVPKTYLTVWKFFFGASGYNSRRMMAFNALFLLLTVLLSVMLIMRLKKQAVLYVVMLIILPVASCAVMLVSGGTMHMLMQYAIGMLYLLPFVLLNALGNGQMPAVSKGVTALALCLAFLIGYHGSAYANGAYVYKQLVYDNTKEAVREIWRDVEAMDGYEAQDTIVNIMGSLGASDALRYDSSLSDRYSGLVGVMDTAVTYDGLFGHMLGNILGKQGNRLRMNDKDIAQSGEYLAMPAYPHEGYVKWIGDEIVVRLSE